MVQENPSHNFLMNFIMGGTSGITAKTMCAPLERVKIVLQTQAANEMAAVQHKGTGLVGMANCGAHILRTDGIKGLWKGNLVNCIRYFPTTAMNFAFKEKYKKMFVPDKEKSSFFRWFIGYLAAGGAAGATSMTVCYPLEFSYTRLAGDTSKQFNGLSHVVRTIYSSEGIRGLYRGYGVSVCGIIVYRAGYFGFYDVGKQYMNDDGSKLFFLKKFGLALVVDISAACFAYPFDTLRRRLMMQSGRSEVQYTSAMGAFKHIVQNEGVGGIYKGVFANNVRAIASALVLVFYDEMKKNFA